jgi:hypothetical protein
MVPGLFVPPPGLVVVPEPLAEPVLAEPVFVPEPPVALPFPLPVFVPEPLAEPFSVPEPGVSPSAFGPVRPASSIAPVHPVKSVAAATILLVQVYIHSPRPGVTALKTATPKPRE